MENRSYLFYLAMISLRYFILAGILFLIFYVFYKERYKDFKIQKMFPKPKDYYREIKYSLLSILIFTTFAFVVFKSPLFYFTKIYKDIGAFGLGYFFVSVVVAIFIHDTYFYWTHRLMHHPKLFRYFHLVHHKSTNPSPWAAYSFHPLEAIVEAGVIFVIVFIVPIHPYAIGLFMLFMFLFNLYGHLGYEIYPQSLLKTKLGKWMNTSTSHNMHHKFFNDNYGLYFRFWDVVMKTTHPKYEETVANFHALPSHSNTKL